MIRLLSDRSPRLSSATRSLPDRSAAAQGLARQHDIAVRVALLHCETVRVLVELIVVAG